VENPAATVEVETEVDMQVLPQTENFGQAKVAQEDENKIIEKQAASVLKHDTTNYTKDASLFANNLCSTFLNYC
jgi:L-lysine 2,3-aminomutase